ncbi:3,4-dihydroxy-2-butanone-4-phosphate synthase [Phyllobacterium sp. 22229]|uniref:3,4-dihydroxy-2-butanone 4-phosphate synthase n=1 Tax=Agrobacterium radiobacter TaxID=362 RepID=A0ABD5LQ51_AGRRD
MSVSTIDEALKRLRDGQMIIVVDDQNRENEGDIVIPADAVLTEHIAFMMRNARGLICIAMEGERLDRLAIPLMVSQNTDTLKTAFTVSVDYVPGTSTGISAEDRAKTVRALVDEGSASRDFSRPGHIFPLRAHPMGVLGRAGHTEAAVHLSRLAGRAPAGVICEIANDDGTMARMPQLEAFAKNHGLLIITIEDLIEYVKDINLLETAA